MKIYEYYYYEDQLYLFGRRTDKIMELYATLDRQFGNMTEGMDFMKPVYSVMGLMAERLLMYENSEYI